MRLIQDKKDKNTNDDGFFFRFFLKVTLDHPEGSYSGIDVDR